MRPLTFSRGKHYIGIDLGTTFSAMAYLDAQGQPVTIPNAENELITPSVVLFEPGGDIVVGREARQSALTSPDRVADCIKRDMGERFYNRPVGDSQIAPEALSALILKKLKQDATARLGPIGGAVITVPAFFDERRREATVSAGLIADLEVLDIINEPTAASLAYGLRDFILKGGDVEEELRLVDEALPPHNALIYDLGGGTFDVTLLSIDGNRFTVLATDGDVRLGGRDWDDAVVDYAAGMFQDQFGSDPRTNPVSYQNLLLAAEQAKMNLSQRDHTRFIVAHDGNTLPVELTLEQFDKLTVGLLYRTEHRLNRVIEATEKSWDQIDQILTVGGSTRMRQVLLMLERITGKKPNDSLSPDEVVAHGAAVHAAITLLRSPKKRAKQAARGDVARKRKKKKPKQPPPEIPAEAALGVAAGKHPGLDDEDVLPFLEEWDEIEADVPESEHVPADTGSDHVSLDDTETVDPDSQATTVGAEREDEDPNELTQVFRAIETTNVNAHSLGVILKRSDSIAVNSIVIPRNTPLPASVTKRYGTNVPNQLSVSIRAVEGESELASECTLIGSCEISQLPWGLRKGSTIYITFSYDNSGRLAVKAAEATSGRSAETTIHREKAMSDEQIDRAKKIVDNIVVS